MVTLLYHPSFAVIPRLHGNSNALDQSHLRNFSALFARTINNRCWYIVAPKSSVMVLYDVVYITPTIYSETYASLVIIMYTANRSSQFSCLVINHSVSDSSVPLSCLIKLRTAMLDSHSEAQFFKHSSDLKLVFSVKCYEIVFLWGLNITVWWFIWNKSPRERRSNGKGGKIKIRVVVSSYQLHPCFFLFEVEGLVHKTQNKLVGLTIWFLESTAKAEYSWYLTHSQPLLNISSNLPKHTFRSRSVHWSTVNHMPPECQWCVGVHLVGYWPTISQHPCSSWLLSLRCPIFSQ